MHLVATRPAPPRPSTWLGNWVGDSMRAGAWLFDYALPLLAIRAYWVIPAQERGVWFGGPSASRQAYAAIKAAGGGGWQVFRQIAVSNHPDRPTLP